MFDHYIQSDSDSKREYGSFIAFFIFPDKKIVASESLAFGIFSI